MSDRIRTLFLSLTVIVVLIFSAIGPTIVYADGGTTTDTPPTEATTTSDQATTETTSSSDEAVTEATAAPEATAVPEATADAAATPEPSTDEATAEPTSASEPTTEEATTDAQATSAPESTDAASSDATAAESTDQVAPTADATVLDQVPENTTVTVVDENGQSQPLATQDAAEAIATSSDPVWCPSTQATPTPGANGCTDSFSSFDALLTAMAGNAAYSGAGTIYVEQGAYSGSGTIDFNSYNLSNISSSDLTVTGGWNTSSGAVDPAATSDFTNTAIVIGSATSPWGGSLSINNINMTFTTTFSNNAANAAMNGLTLYSQGDVNLNNVSVTNAPNDGADINAGRDANVNKSKFERNQKTGAVIRAGGGAFVADSSFSNPANGRRQDTGLDITSVGATSLYNVTANDNREAGAHISSGGRVTIGSSFFSGTKLMNGSGASATFLGYGLQVVTPNSIELDTVTANDNFLWGASLEAAGEIAVANSVFNANTTASPGFIDDTGLIIKGGSNVALNNVTANQNRLYGAVIDATGTVSITNGTFSNNNGTTTTGGVTEYHGHGLKVTSLASINLNNVTASNDMLFGAQLNAAGDVNIANSTFSNCTTCDPNAALGVGLDVVSAGNTSLSNVVLDKNQTVGANIQAGGNVFLDLVTATNNGTDGVNIKQSLCTEVNGGEYSGNGQYGLNLGTSPLDLVTAPTFANNGAGDMVPANPPTCSLIPGTVTPTTSNTVLPQAVAPASKVSANTGITSSVFFNTSLVVPVSGGTANNAGAATLSSFLSNSKISGGGTLASIFFGKYAYLYSSAGMQIVAYAPSSTEVAKG